MSDNHTVAETPETSNFCGCPLYTNFGFEKAGSPNDIARRHPVSEKYAYASKI